MSIDADPSTRTRPDRPPISLPRRASEVEGVEGGLDGAVERRVGEVHAAQRGDRHLGMYGGCEQAEDLPTVGCDDGGADQDPARGVGDQLDQPLLLRDPATGPEVIDGRDLDGVELLAGLRLTEPDRGNLGCREGDPADGAVVGPRTVLAEDVADHDGGL